MTNALIKNFPNRMALALIAAIGPATAASSQTSSIACPVGYESLIENQCIDYKTGNIVLAQEKREPARYTDALCRQGYEILIDNQCIDYKTGNIELAAEPVSCTAQTARK